MPHRFFSLIFLIDKWGRILEQISDVYDCYQETWMTNSFTLYQNNEGLKE